MKQCMLILLLMCGLESLGQQAVWEWATATQAWRSNIETDSAGNVIFAGAFFLPYYIGDSLIVPTSFPTDTAGDLIFSKFGPDGNLLWFKVYGGSNNDEINDMALDSAGNIIIAGSFISSSIVFGMDTIKNTSNGYDVFVAKLDKEGNALWARTGNGTSSDEMYGCATDPFGNVYITGGFEDRKSTRLNSSH